ncbi:DUF4476 domain-containing protein [bacterium]|nr:DUF4476 domain-containing protein [bacterium]
MRVCLFLSLLLVTYGAAAQNSDLIIVAADSVDYSFFIDGKEYKLDNANQIKITEIPQDALLNVSGMLKSDKPIAFFQRLEFKGSFEWVYELTIAEKGNQLELKLLSQNEKTEKYKPTELGENYIVYRYNHYSMPQERVNRSVEAISSIKSKRHREETPTTVVVEEGKTIEKKEERKQTVTEEGASTVIHSERTSTAEGDARETTILRPRKEVCDSAWDDETRQAQMALLAKETDEAGKLYVSKRIAIDHCMTTVQAGDIMYVFESEATRIEIAKFIYPSLIDPENFDALAQYFKSKSSWEAVELYVDVKYR